MYHLNKEPDFQFNWINLRWEELSSGRIEETQKMDKQKPIGSIDKDNAVTLIAWNVYLMKLVISPVIEDKNCTIFPLLVEYSLLSNTKYKMYTQQLQAWHNHTSSLLLSATYREMEESMFSRFLYHLNTLCVKLSCIRNQRYKSS